MTEPTLARPQFKRYVIYAVVAFISMLLLLNVYLIYRNNEVISDSKLQQEQAERAKVNTLDIVRNLHQVDMGIRGYFLMRDAGQKNVTYEAVDNIERVFSQLEATLASQSFSMPRFYTVRDSVMLYFKQVEAMIPLIDGHREAEFMTLLKENRGFFAWQTYHYFSQDVARFEDGISAASEANYQGALRWSYVLQLILFLITLPTLLYTARYTVHALRVSEELRRVEQEKNEILASQKETLEVMVRARTNEILAQNEKISLQNEAILAHNEQLQQHKYEIEDQRNALAGQNEELQAAKKIIEEQNAVIRRKNEELARDVEQQTQNLMKTNAELLEQNSRLEQFTYIISHNLRAPMARLIGLAGLLEVTQEDKEKADIVQLMIKSTTDLDQVIRDLSQILAIQKMSTQVYSEVDVKELLAKIIGMLDEEIRQTDTRIVINLDVPVIYSLPPYMESIFLNLFSNAIKYRYPGRAPVVVVSSCEVNGVVRFEVTDNGLGFDATRHKQNLFGLYKRLHFHVEGKGMGLYLVRSQVEALGGRIEVESEPDKGATFRIYFPV